MKELYVIVAHVDDSGRAKVAVLPRVEVEGDGAVIETSYPDPYRRKYTLAIEGDIKPYDADDHCYIVYTRGESLRETLAYALGELPNV